MCLASRICIILYRTKSNSTNSTDDTENTSSREDGTGSTDDTVIGGNTEGKQNVIWILVHYTIYVTQSWIAPKEECSSINESVDEEWIVIEANPITISVAQATSLLEDGKMLYTSIIIIQS